MPYVQRQNGVVIALFSVLQPGYAEEWLDDSGPEVIAFLNPPAPPYSLPVSVLWVRMSDEEAENFDAAMSTATPLRLRKAFNSANTLFSESELFGFVKSVLASSTSPAKSLEVMARYDGPMAAFAMDDV